MPWSGLHSISLIRRMLITGLFSLNPARPLENQDWWTILALGLVAHVFLGESFALQQILGSMLVMAGVLAISLKPRGGVTLHDFFRGLQNNSQVQWLGRPRHSIGFGPGVIHSP